jgi:hypothetical protein
MQEKHSSAYSKIKLPIYTVFRSLGMTEFGCDPIRVLDSILLEISAVVERKPTLESLELVPHHDCVLKMPRDVLNACMHRVPALEDLGAAKGTATWKQLASTLFAVPRNRPIAVIIDNAHVIMPFHNWARTFAALLPPHVKVVLSITEESGTLDTIITEMASLPVRWPLYQLSLM